MTVLSLRRGTQRWGWGKFLVKGLSGNGGEMRRIESILLICVYRSHVIFSNGNVEESNF